MAIASSNSSSNGENSRKSPVQEKPQHAHYLNEFRVEACPLFKQHQCQQHRPYTCFNWHFANQRRRKPLRKPDGSFNYSPDIYCDKYDENTGICPDGDECQYLHRVSGDVERKYHLRYYKTAQCVHPTDNRGQCVKNGAHCAFAHTSTDVRQPQFDQHDSMYPATVDGEGRDRSSFVIEDPLWHSQDHVLSCYKTEQCRKPARLCRQGYACPFYHNSKDRRRPPAIYKYRSTPCPAAKTVDEWLDPELCEAGDSCQYCHTRTEQQFHPEIYKSTKCNDMLEHGYCPRAVFCAFAHHDSELHLTRTPYVSQTSQPSPKEQCSPNGALTNGNSGSTDSGMRFGSPNSNGGSTPSYSAVLKNRHHTMPGKAYAATTDLISSSYPKAPGFERGPLSPNRNESVLGRLRTHSLNIGHLDMNRRNQILSGNFDFNAGTSLPLSSPLTRSDSGFHAIADNRGSVDSMDAGPPQEFMTRRTLEELSLDLAPIEENNGGRISDLFISANAVTSPMRIPGSDSFHTSPLTSFGENIFSSSSKTMLNSPAQNAFSSFENSLGGGFPIDEVEHSRNDQLAAWEEGLKQARQACEAWKADAEIYRMKAEQAELEKARALFERDQALQQLDSLKMQIAAVNIQAAFANAPQLSGNGSNGSMPSPGNSDYSDGLRAAISQYQMFSDSDAGPACARCGRDRRSDNRSSCPLCS